MAPGDRAILQTWKLELREDDGLPATKPRAHGPVLASHAHAALPCKGPATAQRGSAHPERAAFQGSQTDSCVQLMFQTMEQCSVEIKALKCLSFSREAACCPSRGRRPGQAEVVRIERSQSQLNELSLAGSMVTSYS